MPTTLTTSWFEKEENCLRYQKVFNNICPAWSNDDVCKIWWRSDKQSQQIWHADEQKAPWFKKKWLEQCFIHHKTTMYLFLCYHTKLLNLLLQICISSLSQVLFYFLLSIFNITQIFLCLDSFSLDFLNKVFAKPKILIKTRTCQLCYSDSRNQNIGLIWL